MFSGLRAGSQVFALIVLFLLFILHSMWSGERLHLLCIFPFGISCLSANSKMFVNILLAVCMSEGIVVCEKIDSVSVMNASSQLSCSSCMFVGVDVVCSHV